MIILLEHLLSVFVLKNGLSQYDFLLSLKLIKVVNVGSIVYNKYTKAHLYNIVGKFTYAFILATSARCFGASELLKY